MKKIGVVKAVLAGKPSLMLMERKAQSINKCCLSASTQQSLVLPVMSKAIRAFMVAFKSASYLPKRALPNLATRIRRKNHFPIRRRLWRKHQLRRREKSHALLET